MRVPKDKLKRAIASTGKALKQGHLTKKEAQSLAGFLSFCSQAVQLGWVHMRSIWTFVASFPRFSWSSFKVKRLTAEVKGDLMWWNTLLPTFNGTRAFDDNNRPEFCFFTDACSIGMGGFCAAISCFPYHPANVDIAFD